MAPKAKKTKVDPKEEVQEEKKEETKEDIKEEAKEEAKETKVEAKEETKAQKKTDAVRFFIFWLFAPGVPSFVRVASALASFVIAASWSSSCKALLSIATSLGIFARGLRHQ